MYDWWNEPGADDLCPTSADWLRVMRQLRPAAASGALASPRSRTPAPPLAQEPRPSERAADNDTPTDHQGG